MIATASKPIRKRRQTSVRRPRRTGSVYAKPFIYADFSPRVQYGPNLYAGYYAKRLARDPRGLACFCGPDITTIFFNYVRSVSNYLDNLDDSLTGPVDGLVTMYRIAWNIDFWYKGKMDGCATDKCRDTVMFCGKCVRSTAPNNVLFGMVANALGIFQHDATSGANWVDKEGDENEGQEGAYDIGYDIWDWVKNPKMPWTEKSMCNAVDNATVHLQLYGWKLWYDASDAMQADFKDCKPCGKKVDSTEYMRVGIGFFMGDKEKPAKPR